MVGENDQVLVVLFTLALPSRVSPLNRRRISPLASGAEMLPLKVGVLSSEKESAGRMP